MSVLSDPTGADGATPAAAGGTGEPGVQDGGGEARDASTAAGPDGEAPGGAAAAERAASGPDGATADGAAGAAGGAPHSLAFSGATCLPGGLRNREPADGSGLRPEDGSAGRLELILLVTCGTFLVGFMVSDNLISFLFSFSSSKAKNGRGQQVRGQVPENESLVQVSDPTAGRGAEEKPGEF